MMNISLKSKVSGLMSTIYEGFDERLFKYLLPPGAKLIRFGGSKKGDIVHLKLPFAGEWVSEITEVAVSEDSCYFIDEGCKLPFPLKKWHHKHVFHSEGPLTMIEDDISFSTGNLVVDILIYPVLYFSFLPRVLQYKRYFSKRQK